MTGRGRRVVVVEDDRDLRELVVQVLTDVGFESEGCADGRAALEALQLEDPLLAAIPVVVASSADKSAIPADAYLEKPYGLAELCQVLAQLSLRAAAA